MINTSFENLKQKVAVTDSGTSTSEPKEKVNAFDALKQRQSSIDPSSIQSTTDKKSDSEVGGGFIGNILTGSTQKFGKTIGESLAAPENSDLYAQALDTHTKVQSSLLKAIKDKKSLGQDTTKLQDALTHHIESTPKLEDFTGDVINKSPEQVIGEGVGTGLEALSGGVLSGGAESALSKELSLGQKIKQGAKIGAIYGAVGSGSNTMQDNKTGGEVAADTLTGGVLGAGLGAGGEALIGGASKLYGGAKKILNPSIQDTISKRENEIYNIENNYAKTRRVNEFSNDGGAASRKRIAGTDVLVDSVDQNGLIRTKQPGGAVDKYEAMTIGNTEQLGRNMLEKEGASISPDVLSKKLKSNIENNSLIKGDAKTSALSKIDKEIAGYSRNGDGKIPLVELHDAKIATTKSVKDFATPAEYKTYQKALGSGLKKVIEDTSNTNIGEVNGELTKYLKDINLLENLDGKKVKGGKLGKYFSQISGNIVGGIAGNAIGGPLGSAVGTIVGGELGSRIRGNILSKTLGGVIGDTAPKSQILEKAVADSKLPRLGLPAPRDNFRSSIGSGPTTNLPRKTQTAADEAYSKSLGNRNPSQSTTPNPIKKVITESIPQSEPYTPVDKLPVIEMGKKPQSKYTKPVKGLPTIKGQIDPKVLGTIAGGTALGVALGKTPNKLNYTAPKDSAKVEKEEIIPSDKIGNALAQLESSGGKNKSSADSGEKKWITGLTKIAIDELKRTGIKKSVNINDQRDVLDASIKYFNLMQKRYPDLSPAEIYVDHYWTQSKSPEQRQKKIDEFNRLIS